LVTWLLRDYRLIITLEQVIARDKPERIGLL